MGYIIPKMTPIVKGFSTAILMSLLLKLSIIISWLINTPYYIEYIIIIIWIGLICFFMKNNLLSNLGYSCLSFVITFIIIEPESAELKLLWVLIHRITALFVVYLQCCFFLHPLGEEKIRTKKYPDSAKLQFSY